MKPINLNKESCNPISSNCVIWQGPDLQCIKLCKGDSVSDVVAKLATELCTVLDTLNVQNYDLTCFNITACGPQDFQQLIQFLIDQICAVQNIQTPAPTSTGCPDCLLTVAPCFEIEFPTRVAQLTDYVNAIASRICTIVLQVAALQNSIVDLNDRVTILEGYFPLPSPTEPEIIPEACLGLPLVLTPISTVLSTLSKEFCDLLSATGTSTEIIAAYISQCVNSTDEALATQYSAPGTQMGSEYPTYVVSPSSLADAITNLWLAICDTRNAGKQLAEVTNGINTSVSSSVAVVSNNEVTTYTVDALIDIKNEGTSLTNTPESINFVGDLVNVTTSGNDVTVAINTLGGMLAQTTPSNLNSVAYSLGNVICAQSVQIISEIYDDDNAYDPITGIWTCPATGRYDLSCYAHYSKDTDDGWFDPLNPGGMFGVGVFTSTGCNFYCVNWMTIVGIQKHIDITAQAMGLVITAGTQLSVKVINQTGFNYTSNIGDTLRFSVQRVK